MHAGNNLQSLRQKDGQVPQGPNAVVGVQTGLDSGLDCQGPNAVEGVKVSILLLKINKGIFDFNWDTATLNLT